MFGIDAKSIFQEKISDILIILFATHLLAIIFTHIIKWIRPYLKKCADQYNKQKQKYTSEYSFLPFGCFSRSKYSNEYICKQCEAESTHDDYMKDFENLKKLLEIIDNPSKTILDSSSSMKINMMSDSEFESALSLGNFLRKLSKNKSSSETQTNITINPRMKVDYSRPDLIQCNIRPTPESVIKKSDSSDSFLSASSDNSSADLKKELEQIINEWEINEDGQKEKAEHDVTIHKLQKYLKTSLAKTDVSSSFRQNEKKGIQENKLLEMAIAEFEKELKPIKEQIQILKECISGFDLSCNPQNSIPSDFTSLFSGSGLFSESCSGTVSTCLSTDLQSYFSSYHIISATSFSSIETDHTLKNMKKLDRMASLCPSKIKHKTSQCCKLSCDADKEKAKIQEVLNRPEKCKSKKRSPIAEMYVKLSQNSSQSFYLVKSKKEKLISRDNTVTYRIDLNVNVAGVPAPIQKSKLSKEREIQPLTSDPDEIIGKPPDTHIPL